MNQLLGITEPGIRLGGERWPDDEAFAEQKEIIL